MADDGRTTVYVADLDPLNESGVDGTTLLTLDGEAETLTVRIMADGLVPGMVHPQHIHGRLADTAAGPGTGQPIDSVTPNLLTDDDNDGFIELNEGLDTYGPIILPLMSPPGGGLDAFPTAPDGTIDFVATYDLSGDNPEVFADGFTAEDLTPLHLREIVLHGAFVPEDIGEGTPGEVDGGPREYLPVLPIASGEIVALADGLGAVADGTGDADELFGTDRPDVIGGLDGDDRIFGFGGDDLLLGDAGDDTVVGGEGGDALFGGEGVDRLFGEVGDDELFGGAGDDCGGGEPGGGGLFGGAGNDLLDGGGGDDLLVGGADNDILAGGAGDDRMFGEAGEDRFVFLGTEAPIDADEVVDFQRGEDVLELSGFAGLNTFDDLGDRIEAVGGDTVIDLSDAFGNAPGTDTITVAGVTGLGAADVIVTTDGATV